MTSRICVVGAGRWGRNHIRTLHQLGALAGIVDSDDAAVRELAAEYPDARTFTNIKDAAAAGFDGFTVATPAETHNEIGRFLLERAFPVLIEKPMALRAAEARELRDLASEKKVPLMVGHVMLFHPAIVEMKRLIETGKIGRLEYLYSNRLNLGTVRTEENILWSFAPHDLSIFQSLIGTLPTEVLSRGGAYLQPLIHDTTMTILTYPNNIVGHIFVSWLHPFKEHRLMVVGSKGMLSFEDSAEDRRLLFYEKGIDWVQGEPIKRDGPTEKISYEATPPLERELRYFIERIGDRGPVEIAGPESAIEVLEILERASESLIGPAAPGADASPRASSSASSDHRYFVHESSFVDDDVEIGEGTKIWHFSHVQSGVRIGRACSIGQNVNIGNNVRIGNNVKIQNNVSVYEGVELEDYVFCGPSMVFTNVNDPRSKYPQRGAEHYSKTLVREGASIGANATIVCGNTIGRHAFVAAGAVVTHNVPDYALVAGIPARRRDWVCECGEVLPPVSDDMTCPRCERRYRLADGRLHPQ